MPKGILVSGSMVFDVHVRPVEAITWGASHWVEDLRHSVGGTGASTAYAAAMLGATTRIAGTLGSDWAAEWLLSQLQFAGVNTELVVREEGRTTATVGLVRKDGERCFLCFQGVAASAFSKPFEFFRTCGCDHYHLGSPFAMPLQRPLLAENLRRAREAGLTTSMDTQWDAEGQWLRTLAPALPLLDMLFINEDEARMLTGRIDDQGVVDFLHHQGVRIVVYKKGAQGCFVSGPGISVRQEGFKVPVVDTIGAGDVFAGAYLAAYHGGLAHEEAAHLGCAVAALTIQELGGVTAALRDAAQVRAELSRLPGYRAARGKRRAK